MKSLDLYWMTNDDWWDVKDGRQVLNENAPEEAQESFKRYLEQIKVGDGDY